MKLTLIALVSAASLSAAATLNAQQFVDAVTAKEALRHYRAAQDALQHEQFELALSKFSEAVRLDPMLALAHYGRGQAHMALKDFPAAVKAYERAADRYSDRSNIAADAIYKAGMAHRQQAKRAEYDQSAAGLAIATLTDFMTLYPNDPRVKQAEKEIADLRTEQARGSFEIAKFYEKRNRLQGALIYYNEVLVQDATSPFAETARQRIDEIKAAIVGAK